MKICPKCGSARFNDWNRCMDCRNARAKLRQKRIKKNGGSHTNAEWNKLLNSTDSCVVCGRKWHEIPRRRDPRYKHTWTKGHIKPVIHGGTNNIDNIQPECYQCNFKKNSASSLKNLTPEVHVMTTPEDRFSHCFSFTLINGNEVFPIKVKNRETGRVAFRISKGGKGGNTLEAGFEVDEQEMVEKVLHHGFSVRCAPQEGGANGLYSPTGRSVIRINKHQ